jgi:hypothetical protein
VARWSWKSLLGQRGIAKTEHNRLEGLVEMVYRNQSNQIDTGTAMKQGDKFYRSVTLYYTLDSGRKAPSYTAELES